MQYLVFIYLYYYFWYIVITMFYNIQNKCYIQIYKIYSSYNDWVDQ